jgi:hypothetical protein
VVDALAGDADGLADGVTGRLWEVEDFVALID